MGLRSSPEFRKLFGLECFKFTDLLLENINILKELNDIRSHFIEEMEEQ